MEITRRIPFTLTNGTFQRLLRLLSYNMTTFFSYSIHLIEQIFPLGVSQKEINTSTALAFFFVKKLYGKKICGKNEVITSCLYAFMNLVPFRDKVYAVCSNMRAKCVQRAHT